MFGCKVRTRLSLLTKPERDKARIKQALYFRGKRKVEFRPRDQTNVAQSGH